MKKVTVYVLTALVFLCCSAPLSAFTRIISPVTGTWANKQSLVLNVRDDAECFYSYSGTDPLTSGFMYDGPVLIDASGDVTLRVVCCSGDSREEYQIAYTVTEQAESAFEDNSIERNFIDLVSAQPLYVCGADQTFTIPQTFSYCLGDGVQPFLPGMALSIDARNSLSRYIPCTVVSNNGALTQKWRFVIFLAGSEAGTLAKYQVPFELQYWNTFIWTGEKLIYSIDDGDWSANRKPIMLDRSVPHIIRWQSVAYEKGNPVQAFELPAKPSLTVRAPDEKKGPVIFSIQGDARYRMEITDSGNGTDAPSSDGLFSQAVFDTFAGDYIGGTAVFALYCDGVYQGDLSASYVIDNKPPLAPVFTASAENGEYARKPVEMLISSEDGASIYYAVSKAQSIDENADVASLAPSVAVGSFRQYDGERIVLNSGENKALFYKVCAYAVDSAGNIGAISDYTVVIDEYNYYLVEGAAPGGDGSKSRPLSEFSQVLSVINGGRFAHFFVTGTIAIPSGEHAFTSNASFTSLGAARFVFPPDAHIVLRSASLAAKGCVFEKERPQVNSKKLTNLLFKLESAAISFDACELVGIFGDNGTAFAANNSVIDFVNSGLTVQSDVYACAVSSSDSKVTGKESRFIAIAPTAVNFSVQGGLFELRSSDCKVVAHLGRIAELTRTNARVTDNSYTGEFDTKVSRVSAVWKDDSTLMLENTNNSSVGF